MKEYDKELLEVPGGVSIVGTPTQRAIRVIFSQSTELLQSGLLERIRESKYFRLSYGQSQPSIR